MEKDEQIYGVVENQQDLRAVYSEIRADVEKAGSRDELTELYRRAGYLITLTKAPSWETKFGDEINEIRDVAYEEFTKTARAINNRAAQVGTAADYDESWGDGWGTR
jgi:hypothetical protein